MGGTCRGQVTVAAAEAEGVGRGEAAAQAGQSGSTAAAMGGLKDELLKTIWHAFTALDLDHSGKVSKSQLKVGAPPPCPGLPVRAPPRGGSGVRGDDSREGRAGGKEGSPAAGAGLVSHLPSGRCAALVPAGLPGSRVGSLSREPGSLLAREAPRSFRLAEGVGSPLGEPAQNLPLSLGEEGTCPRSPGRDFHSGAVLKPVRCAQGHGAVPRRQSAPAPGLGRPPPPSGVFGDGGRCVVCAEELPTQRPRVWNYSSVCGDPQGPELPGGALIFLAPCEATAFADSAATARYPWLSESVRYK